MLRGLAWGHRRATGPLAPLASAFRARTPGVEVAWEVRPLAAFEHGGIARAASLCDFVIFDHPFSGDVAATGCLLPLPDDLLGDDARWLGPSLASYRWEGRTYGLPVDAAAMHAVWRQDLLDAPPASWADTLALGPALRRRGLWLALPVHTPHAILALASLMANMGRPWETDHRKPFGVDREGFEAAYGTIRELLAFAPPECLGWNAIDLHDAMARRDDLAFCPAAYGYGTYGEPDAGGTGGTPLAFAPFAGAVTPFHRGSTLGGTALGLSASCAEPEAALAFLRFCASEGAQRIVRLHHGQPALAAEWTDEGVAFGGFFAAARSSIEEAWIRPRRHGYIPFQQAAGRALAEALREEAPARSAWARVARLAEEVA